MSGLFEGSPALIYAVVDGSDPTEIVEACEAAARHRLAVAGWVFFEVFKAGREGDTSEYTIKRMAMAYDAINGAPVGCAVGFHAWGDYNAGCFVRASHRRMRIGSRLIESLLQGEQEAVRIHDGIQGSMDFWHNMGANEFGYIRE